MINHYIIDRDVYLKRKKAELQPNSAALNVLQQNLVQSHDESTRQEQTIIQLQNDLGQRGAGGGQQVGQIFNNNG